MSTTPFLKWCGGKAGLLTQLYPLMPPDVRERRHVELFIGGGALFFAREDVHGAFIADANPRLIATYHAVRDHVEDVIGALETLDRAHRVDPQGAYYLARTRFNAMPKRESSIRLAAHFIYLNRTCFNGLYRENKGGGFNVPMGSYKNPTIVDHTGLRRCALALRDTTIEVSTFEVSAEWCTPNDFVYLDPPYEPVSRTAAFTAYGAAGFDQDDQRRLAATYRALDDRGCKVMLSNSDVPFIRELYRDYQIDTVQARRAINSDPTKRGPVGEVVVRNY